MEGMECAGTLAAALRQILVKSSSIVSLSFKLLGMKDIY